MQIAIFRTKENFMQNFRTKAHSIDRWGKIAVAAMLSVAMAAVIFWGLTRTGNTDKTVAEMSIAQTIRGIGRYFVRLAGHR